MSSQIFSRFSVILLVLGHPERSSSSSDTRLALKHECHSITDKMKHEVKEALV
jgi:hypothetical protein